MTEQTQQVVVLDASQRHRLPTGRVIVRHQGQPDAELAKAAGAGSQHFGWTVTRHEDSTATVALWND